MQERTVKGVVSQMSAHEVYEVVSNMKQLVEKEPDKAKQMFVSHPQVNEHVPGKCFWVEHLDYPPTFPPYKYEPERRPVR